MAEVNVVWQEQGLSVCKLSLEEIAGIVTQGQCWVLPATSVHSRTSEASLMTDQMFFNNDWIRRLSERHVEDIVAVIVSKTLAPTENEARELAEKARGSWMEKTKGEELATREKVKMLTQKAKLACQRCAALTGALKGVNIFDDEKNLITDPVLQKQIVSLGLALESLADIISSAIEALLNGDPEALVKADQGLSEISESEIRFALKTALDALGAGHEAGLKKQELEEVFLAAFFSSLLREKGGEYSSRVYNVVRTQKPKIPDAAGIIRHHEHIEWMGFSHYVRRDGSYLVSLISGEELKKILVTGLSLEFNVRVAQGETAEMVLEDMGWRYKEPAAGPLYSVKTHITSGLPPYSLAWSGLCNRLGLVPKKAIVEFTHKTELVDTVGHLRVPLSFKGNAAQFLGLLGGTGVSLGHRTDLKFSPLVWLCWRKEADGKYSVLAPADTTSASSITSVAGADGKIRMALLAVGLGEMNPQIYGPKRRRVAGLLDNMNFIAIKNGVERAINIPQVLHDLAAHHARRA